jgi:hypothetical protein
MKPLRIIALLLAVSQLTGCAGDIWMTVYRYKGGYYDRPSKPIKTTTPNRSTP